MVPPPPATAPSGDGLPERLGSVLHHVKAWALAAPDSVALACQDPGKHGLEQAMSYAAVWSSGLRAAEVLKGCTRHTEAPYVGVLVAGGAELPLLELAALLAGGAVVPVDPEDPWSRQKLLMEDARLAVVVVQDAAAEIGFTTALAAAPELAAPVVLQAGELLRASRPDEALGVVQSAGLPLADAVSHVFFTSGSTGRPKGCICTHGNLEAYCLAKNAVHGVAAGSAVFVASAHTFDPSLGDFFATWAAGACVKLSSRAATTSALGGCLRGSQATHLLATPALFATLEAAGVGPADLPALHVIALGGELMPQTTVDLWAGAGKQLLNVYGVTECTVYQAFARLSPGSSPRWLSQAFPGGTALLLASGDGSDPERLVEDRSGDHGELWIQGPQVGRGYLRRPELSAERFAPWPGPPARFRTGDIAAADPQGGFRLVGRRDGLVKLRGLRIELGEVEEALLAAAAPGLLRAVAVVPISQQLTAWCVPSAEAAPEVSGPRGAGLLAALLRMACEERLPRHMIPASFVPLEQLPTTGTGKVSRRELAARPLPAAAEGPFAPLESPAERLVARAWEEVLGVPVASRTAHFAALGGDSIAALRVCRRLAAEAGADAGAGTFGELLPEHLLPASLLRRPQLCDFAGHLAKACGGPFGAGGEEVRRGEDSGKEASSGEAKIHTLRVLLHAAVGLGAPQLLQHLLAAGAPAGGGGGGPGGEPGRGPLHAACAAGHAAVVGVLLAARAAACAPDPHGVQPLHLAAQGGSLEVVEALLRARAQPGVCDADGQSALHHAARAGAALRVLATLLEASAGAAAARKGAARGRPRAPGNLPVGRLLDARDCWGRTPLHWAVVNGHRTVASWLLGEGADRALRDKDQETALDIAERRAQCRAQDRPEGFGASTFGDIATLLGGSAATLKVSAAAAKAG